MRDHILHHIDQIEKQHDVKVLYACDAGSRAYGLHAPGSDYDVRFIYIHKPDWYLSIDQQRDVIELPVDDLLDMNGWDLQKALKLFRKSNPPLFEWLQSELVYLSDSFFVKSIKELEAEVFSPVPVLYHYFHMAKGNVKDYLMQDVVKVKKYLHVLRPILMCKWIETYKEAPPIHFDKLLNDLSLNSDVKQALQHLKDIKKSPDGQEYVTRSPVLHDFIEREVEHLERYIQAQDTTKKEITPQLNQLFLENLQHTWGKFL
ncbi:nucleotidyltransferase domain-containing protein [Pontibacillus marinus]|uniref:Nucleotidyltransferase n=1 Tax=Pontibacillus marinus BH030004 = DSM 16465 TaxID=1385511 RepID=A0A0A5HQP4_9BACI|nr:nucleotidyltransferase domain-containing protein [Pontibacillus marinus]KGX85937.1 hypothetical protein N783_13170 [Pontibacillus marinus BH030004 = DSM 16465]